MKREFADLFVILSLMVAIFAAPLLWMKVLLVLCQAWYLFASCKRDEEEGDE